MMLNLLFWRKRPLHQVLAKLKKNKDQTFEDTADFSENSSAAQQHCKVLRKKQKLAQQNEQQQKQQHSLVAGFSLFLWKKG